MGFRTTPVGRLATAFSTRRKVQFVGVFALTLVGAAAELVSIGAVVPFLQVVAAPETLLRLPGIVWVMNWLGLTGARELLWPAAIFLIFAAVLAAAIRIMLVWVTSRFVYGLTHDLSMSVFETVIRQPYELYVKRNTADVLSGIEKVNYVGGYFLNPLMTALSSVVIAIGIIIVLLIIDPMTAVLAGGTVALLYVIVGLLTRRMLVRFGDEQAAFATRRIKLAQESVGGVRDIILDSSHDTFAWQFRVVDARSRKLSAITNFISLAPRYVVECTGVIIIAVFALFFAGQPGGVIAAIPVLGALALGAQRLLPLAQNINVAFVQYASMGGMVGDVLDLLEAPVRETGTMPEGALVKRMDHDLVLDSVSYAYETGRPALHDISLTVPKGARIGIVGRTGSGKTTLLDVLMGLLPPTSGSIHVDGDVLTGETLRHWQAQLAHVPQSIFLIDNSIAANIAFGVPGAQVDMERVRDAALRADVAEFVERLPEGYQTMVGERGVRLSGGQRQRLGIARALYKRATVLILDEATSALDDATETAVMAGIEQLDRGLTILMIAHRLTTVANCDLIVRLEHGRIVARGSYAEVVGASGEAPAEA